MAHVKARPYPVRSAPIAPRSSVAAAFSPTTLTLTPSTFADTVTNTNYLHTPLRDVFQFNYMYRDRPLFESIKATNRIYSEFA